MSSISEGIYLIGKYCGSEPSSDGKYLRCAIMCGLKVYHVALDEGESLDGFNFGDQIGIKANLWEYNGRFGFNHGTGVTDVTSLGY